MKVKVKVFNNSNNPLPEYQTSGSSGCDVYSTEDILLYPGDTDIIKTGLYMSIPKGFEIQVRPRSGLSYKTKMRVSNSPGTIDSDYRDEVGVIVDNIGTHNLHISKGERIAQFVLQEVLQLEWDVVESIMDLHKTNRQGGFGSTGT